jgi:hypothetical protein
MNKLSKIVGTVCISLMGSIGSANADASAFTGAYVAVTGSAIGMALAGTKTRTVTGAKSTKAKVGMVSPAAGAEIGFSYPLSDMAFITVGASYQPFDTSIKGENVTDTKDVTLTSVGDYGAVTCSSLLPFFSRVFVGGSRVLLIECLGMPTGLL